MKKTIMCIVLAVLFIFTGCSQGAKVEKRSLPYFSEDIPVPYLQTSDYNHDDLKFEPLPEAGQNKVNEILDGMLNYLNSEYNAGWKKKDIQAFIVSLEDLNSNFETITFGAMYYEGKLCIDKTFFESDENLEGEQLQYVISHELIHFLYEINVGKDFCLMDSEGKKCGVYLDEAFVDELAYRYSIKIGFSESNVKSGYKYLRMSIGLMEYSCPDIFKYFFKGDIDGLKKYLHNSINKRVVLKGNGAEKLLHLLDLTFNKTTQNNISYLASFLIAMIPRKYANEVDSRFSANGLEVGRDIASLMMD